MNLLHILLFLVYTMLCCLFIKKSKQFAHSSIYGYVFIGIFLLRLVAGFVYAYIYSLHPYNLHSDTWSIFRSSLEEYEILLKDPVRFVQTTFVFKGDISYSNFTQGGSSYWNILKEVILVKFEAVLNLFSFGNYYVNLVIFSFLMLLGSNYFFKTLEKVYPDRPFVNLLLAFLVPSTVFWTSAIYKDGLLFFLLSIVCYQTIKWLEGKRKIFSYLLILGVSLAGLFLLRTYVALLVVPALFGWVLSEKTRVNPVLIFPAVYGFALALAMVMKFIHPAFDFPALIASWQEAFLRAPANSALPAKKLEPTFFGLLKNLPQSFNFAFLRPLLWENKGKQYLLFALELFLMQLLFIYSLFQRSAPDRRRLIFRLFCFSLAFTGCLFLGYTVHIIGALVRYRSIFFPFLFAAVVSELTVIRKRRATSN